MKVTDINNYKILLTTENNQEINRIGGVKTNSPHHTWVPLTEGSVEMLLELMPNDELLLKAKAFIENEDFVRNFDVNLESHDILRDYQNDVLKQIRQQKSFGLFMQMRLGKTPTSIVATKDFNKIIVSVPNGLQKSWLKAYKQFGDRQDVTIIKGTPNKRKEMYLEWKNSKSGILIGPVDTLAKDADFIRGSYDYLILDEAHFLRNKTLKTKGTLKLRKGAKHALALTGTPATSKAEDVIPILMFLHPKAYTKWGLIEYYFNVSKGRFGLSIDGIRHNKQVEWTQLLNRFSVIMKTRDYMEWVPEVTKVEINLDMETSQQKVYDKMLDKFKLDTSTGIERSENVLTQMIRLSQIGLDPAIIDSPAKSVKTKWVKQYIKEHKDEPIIIWSTNTTYLKKLEVELADYKPLAINGEIKAGDRQDNVDKFQAGETNLMLINIKAGNTGYTIDRCTTMIFMNRDWNPTENEQANFRFVPTQAHHKKLPRTIIDVMANESIDENIKYANDNKLSATDIVNNFNKWIRNGRK